MNERGGKIIASKVSNAFSRRSQVLNLGGPNWAFPSGCTTQTFYNWDPTSAMGVSESGMLGVEGAIWSEHLRTEHDMQFVTLPRLYALAEVGWTPQSQRNYADFASRLP
ncbi:family 20 glycosylhydrolase [Bifidobacterium tsurumiense]|uniref:family 20 glycosylhydrolase n=1 Tax=Bifidobacterium tsurumiense TaxID=356829 RepID=UPI0005C6852B|nr:family 20 glycosylhydrolase [Bifidobacterium tsurumiense]